MISFDTTIKGLQEAQAKNVRRIAMLQPRGEFGGLIRDVTAFAHRQAVIVTHVDTGALRASHRMEVRGVVGRVFIDPRATNPKSRAKPVDYGPVEHARGGSHAFYDRSVEATRQFANRQGQVFARMVVR